jgi:flagellar biosynthesis regulator FlbT
MPLVTRVHEGEEIIINGATISPQQTVDLVILNRADVIFPNGRKVEKQPERQNNVRD